jgi:hypothetical protein
MSYTPLSNLTDQELLQEVLARNPLDPLILELAARLENKLDKPVTS